MGRLWPAMESLETPPEYYTVKKGLKDPEKALDALCFEIYKQTKLVVFYSNVGHMERPSMNRYSLSFLLIWHYHWQAVPCDDSKTTCRCQPRTVTCALFLGRQRKEECATWAQKETIGALLGLTQNGVIEVEPTCEDLSV